MIKITMGANDKREQSSLLLAMANRHGLIAGATGTGKTVTLKVLAEQFSSAGVPVFLCDVKGDLSGFIEKGAEHPEISRRCENAQLNNFSFETFPSTFWDIFSESGHGVRTTVSEMGPLLFSRLLELNQNQEDVINLAFKYADENGLLLLDLKDLRSVVKYISEAGDEQLEEYGRISKASVGVIVRRISTLEEGGGDFFFGETALEITDFLRVDSHGKGVINILDSRKLIHDQRLYSTFLLWFLSELLEELPEVGDVDKPKLVFFFDEAHLIFKDTPKVLFEKIELVVKLIRSKGVGVYFVTQDPSDIPQEVLSQLGNRIVHGLRAFSEKDRKAIRAISKSFRTNEDLDVEAEITKLAKGESLVSFLNEEGAPGLVQKILNAPPASKIGPANESVKRESLLTSPLGRKYSKIIDRKSAYEVLLAKKQNSQIEMNKNKSQKKKTGRQSPLEAFMKSVLRSIGSQLGRQIIRGVMGSFKR